MRKIINCDCGYVVRGDNDDELVRAAQQHAWDAHQLRLTPAQVLSLAVPEER